MNWRCFSFDSSYLVIFWSQDHTLKQVNDFLKDADRRAELKAREEKSVEYSKIAIDAAQARKSRTEAFKAALAAKKSAGTKKTTTKKTAEAVTEE